MNCATPLWPADAWLAGCSMPTIAITPTGFASLVALGERRNVATVADNQFPVTDSGREGRRRFRLAAPGAGRLDADIRRLPLGRPTPMIPSTSACSSRSCARSSCARRASPMTEEGRDSARISSTFSSSSSKAGMPPLRIRPYYFYTQPFRHGPRASGSHGARPDATIFQGRPATSFKAHLARFGRPPQPVPDAVPEQAGCRRFGALENFFPAPGKSFARCGWRGFIARLVKHPATFDYAIRRLSGRYLVSAAAASRDPHPAGARSGARDGSSRPRLPASREELKRMRCHATTGGSKTARSVWSAPLGVDRMKGFGLTRGGWAFRRMKAMTKHRSLASSRVRGAHCTNRDEFP